MVEKKNEVLKMTAIGHVYFVLIDIQFCYKCRYSIHIQTGFLNMLQVDFLYLFTGLKQLVHFDTIVGRRFS